MKTPIEVFSDWVDIGKDEGMEKNHYMPVMEMIKLYNTSYAYSFIDAGCGNAVSYTHLRAHETDQ